MTNNLSSTAWLAKFLISCFLFISCTSTKNNGAVNSTITNKPLGSPEAFDKEAHRGGRGLMPENTIPAMLNALGLQVTTLEMDISISKDKKVLLSHEPFFSKDITTKPDGSYIGPKELKSYNLYKMDYEEIAKYDVGMKMHPLFPEQQKVKAVKPLLSDVFKAVKEYMITVKRPFPFYNIEIKSQPEGDNIYHPLPAEFVELVMGVIKENQMEEQVIIQSFDFRSLQYMHQHYPAIKTSVLIEANNKSSFRKQIKDLGFTPTIYSPDFLLVTPELIRDCHELNMKVIPWTVNDKNKIEELTKMGVDGIITDYPNLFN
ncbi:MAG TPA: glycerophosphodiester phosphodiesterase [Ferruginibacter sp.]|jgi:glycerophosphoryl diester phosphodiesterase|nr:glycerophosphodiester phosphodiesterase [Ferruginibacter sp.]